MKSSQEHLLHIGFPQGSILSTTLFLLYISPSIVQRSFIVTRRIFVFLPLAGSKTSKFSFFDDSMGHSVNDGNEHLSSRETNHGGRHKIFTGSLTCCAVYHFYSGIGKYIDAHRTCI